MFFCFLVLTYDYVIVTKKKFSKKKETKKRNKWVRKALMLIYKIIRIKKVLYSIKFFCSHTQKTQFKSLEFLKNVGRLAGMQNYYKIVIFRYNFYKNSGIIKLGFFFFFFFFWCGWKKQILMEYITFLILKTFFLIKYIFSTIFQCI